jgi:hypothetical protein
MALTVWVQDRHGTVGGWGSLPRRRIFLRGGRPALHVRIRGRCRGCEVPECEKSLGKRGPLQIPTPFMELRPAKGLGSRVPR